ncbi:WW domain binding protein 11-domain-containing protein [Ampelomyces quisqualis]|uniref:WW domain binding protein 11-domain-containing protein n=1 Tax=Ampelomyces quisqualis TaxID=50730 RepID=A0A6A5QN43_AMPQU|nr:WW domain binding protein 11-domain-containing protein [Ampelomyces quisqualis]
MAKEKNYNPVQDHKKQEKQKQIRKQKANLQAQRNEKLARRNPNRIQRDIDSLKESEQGGGLRPHERQRLAELEKDLAAVIKAREALGDKAPQFKPERKHDDGGDRDGRGGHRGGRGGVLGKRTRDGQRKEDDSSDTDADVRDIPMPRDTPPPIPRQRNRKSHADDTTAEPEQPKRAQIVYEAAPEVRNFLKEATRFMPTAVANKMKLAKGEGRLLEPEEFDKLQDEGYMEPKKQVAEQDDEELEAFLKNQRTSTTFEAEQAAEAAVQEATYEMMAAEAAEDIHNIASEAAVAEKKLRQVEMEEVDDEDM